MTSDHLILTLLYEELLVEGLEEKIPKLLNLVDPKVEDKENYIRWAAETFDPTLNSEYITWILRLLKKGSIRGEEDSGKMKERLEQFHALKRKPQFPADRRDINRFKTYGDLAETVDEFSGIETKGEVVRKKREQGIELMEEGDDVKLFVVTESEAAAKYFRNTDWCVKDPRYFDNYGVPYYFFTDGNEKPQTLLHLNSKQCMDVRDRPTNLSSDQQELMETEKMTDYVIANDNSDTALAFYSEKVGEGFDGNISSIFWDRLNKMLSDANSSLEMFTIEEPDNYELEFYEPTAFGSIPYDMTPYENHVGDKDFLKVLRDVLYKFDIYPDNDWEYGDQFSEDLQTIYLNIRYDSSSNYRDESITDRLQSFISELKQSESRFDAEEFDEVMNKKMTEEGYISSGWADFKNKVSINDLPFKNFSKKEYGNLEYTTNNIELSESELPESHIKYAQSFDIVDVEKLLSKHKRQDHPYVLLAEFVRPFVDRGLEVHIGKGAGQIKFVYKPKFEQDKTGKQYIRGLKAVKDFDTHFDFYLDQIKGFMDKFVYPYLRNFERTSEGYGIPENIKIPYIQIKNRKESPDQMMLGLHERKSFYDFAVARNVI
jgi:hypothetical protein